jgi:uncharacterized protein Yka (UPF0111/DUF47 family)
MSDETRKAFKDLHTALQQFGEEVTKVLYLREIVDWLARVIDRASKP